MELQACNYPISGHTPSPKDFLREYRLTHWRDMSEQHPDLTALVVNSEQLSWQERALCAQKLRTQIETLHNSATWRIGRKVMLPIRIIKRIVK